MNMSWERAIHSLQRLACELGESICRGRPPCHRRLVGSRVTEYSHFSEEYDMFYWIYDIPIWQLAIMFAGVSLLYFLGGCLLVRPIIRRLIPSLSGANDIVGNILSGFGVFYGLLIGLIAVAAYQDFDEVGDNVSKEVVALSALYEDVKAFPDPDGQNLRWLLRDYCRYVIKYAWPLQREGIVPEGGRIRVVAFQEKLLRIEPRSRREEIDHAEALHQFNIFLEARQAVLNSVTTGIPAVMWYVVIVGAMINLALVWMFDSKLANLLVLGGLLAFFLGTIIFLIAAMDNPLRGDISISPDQFESLYKIMMEDSV